MTNLLEKGSEFLKDKFPTHMGVAVTYSRGEDSVDVDAGIDRSTFEIDNGAGLLQTFESRDFIIRVSDLVIGDEAIEPQPGDRISETADSVTYVYEVLAPGGGPCAPYVPPLRKCWRVHTKLVEET